jgi:hypothetical protein
MTPWPESPPSSRPMRLPSAPAVPPQLLVEERCIVEGRGSRLEESRGGGRRGERGGEKNLRGGGEGGGDHTFKVPLEGLVDRY